MDVDSAISVAGGHGRAPPYHDEVRRTVHCLLAAAAIALAACGGTSAPSPTPTRPTGTTTPRPTPTPIPAPDTERVDVVATGIGVYQAVVVPVAVLHNAATRTGISGVSVQFVLSRGGRALAPLESPAVTLYPGQTLAVTADCTDACNNQGTIRPPDSVAVTITGGTWAPLPGSPLTATGIGLSCISGCGGGQGQWDVSTTLGSPELAQGTRVDIFTWCTDAAGAITGGNPPSVVQWPQQGGSLSLTLHAILRVPPTSCQVGASAPI